MHRTVKVMFVLTFLLLLPAAAFAQQGQIAGTVRDATGSVLPGVLVEATSPALIEKVRSTTTMRPVSTASPVSRSAPTR
jgi:hypothetical protein